MRAKLTIKTTALRLTSPSEGAEPGLPRFRLSLRSRALLALGLIALAIAFLTVVAARQSLMAGMFGVAVEAAVIAGGFALITGLVRPIAALADCARMLANTEHFEIPSRDRPDEIGDLARALVAWRYEAAQQLAMSQLAAEEAARFRMVFDRAPIGICRGALDGRILDSNTALQAMLGYEGSELMGLRRSDITHPEDATSDADLAASLEAAGDRGFTMEQRFLQRDGATFWAALTASVVRRPDGMPTYFVCMIEDINERKRQEVYLRHQALHDSLTGLPNRAMFMSRLEAALANTAEAAGTTLLLIDLDGFKAVNDTHGHHAGDELLQQVAWRFSEGLRSSDTIARLGGDEFAVVLPSTTRSGAELAARKLRAEAKRPFMICGHRVEVGASIGIASHPTDGGSSAELIQAADRAMYVAKRSGGRQLAGAEAGLV